MALCAASAAGGGDIPFVLKRLASVAVELVGVERRQSERVTNTGKRRRSRRCSSSSSASFLRLGGVLPGGVLGFASERPTQRSLCHACARASRQAGIGGRSSGAASRRAYRSKRVNSASSAPGPPKFGGSPVTFAPAGSRSGLEARGPGGDGTPGTHSNTAELATGNRAGDRASTMRIVLGEGRE